MSEEQLPDVEQINGFAVGFSYLRFYRLHPEIGLPVSDQSGDVGGFQVFQNAQLTWTGEKIKVNWYSSGGPTPDWLAASSDQEFEV
jgi:uncharacterized protein with LGFP repeats